MPTFYHARNVRRNPKPGKARDRKSLGLRGAEGVLASLAFDEGDRLLLGHGLAAILSPCFRQARRQLQPHDLPIDYCLNSHADSIALPTSMLKKAFAGKRNKGAL